VPLSPCLITNQQLIGTGVTQRHLSRLEQAIGSPRRPVLFKAIRNRLQKALTLLNSQVTRELQVEMNQILNQIGSDIEMLRGTEAQVLANNGDFLDKLGKVMAEMETQISLIAEMTAAIKAEAERNGYFLC
jgi:hypothetical protein